MEELQAARKGLFPYQFHRYFTREEFFELMSPLVTLDVKAFDTLTFTDTFTDEDYHLTARYLKNFPYYSMCYLPQTYWQDVSKDIVKPMVVSSRATPILAFINNHFDHTLEAISAVVNQPDFLSLSSYKQGHALINSVGLSIEDRLCIVSTQAKGIAAAVLVVLFPLLRETHDDTLTQVHKYLRPRTLSKPISS